MYYLLAAGGAAGAAGAGVEAGAGVVAAAGAAAATEKRESRGDGQLAALRGVDVSSPTWD